MTCCEGGYNLAGWLLGFPSTTTTAEGIPITKPRQNRWSAYFLDDWKVTRKLTFNAGLRWDFFQVPVDANGLMRNLRLDILTRAADGRDLPTLIPTPRTKDFAFVDNYRRYFMPRVGLAYRVTDKWVVRSGAGWFVNAQQLNNFSPMALQPPISGTLRFNQVTDVAQVIPYSYADQTYNIQTRRFRPGTPILTLDNAFPGVGTAAARSNLLAMPANNRFQNHWQWSLDVQRELPWNTSLTVAYVGSKTSHLDASVYINNPDPSPNQNIDIRRPYQAYVSQGEDNQARGLGAIRYLDNFGNGSYHALQTTVEKRYSSGFVWGLAYTYGKALGEGHGRNEGGGDFGAESYQNPRDRRSSRTRFSFDITHSAVINYVYEMPFLNRFKGVAGGFLGGWQTNGILTFRTGFPFGPVGGNLNTGPEVASRADRVADGRLGDKAKRELWFDPAAFRRTDCNIPNRLDLCHYGNAGDGILVEPGARVFDLSLYKNWRLSPLGEQGRLQFRAEFYNAFNTPQFGRPNNLAWASLDSIIPDAPRVGEIRRLRQPMRVIQFGLKLYF